MTDEQRDKYLRRKYNISLPEFNELAKNGCVVCGAPPKTRNLHTDHDHRVEKSKITVARADGGWLATSEEFPWLGSSWNRLKSKAAREIRRQLLRLSVRGVLDWQCNSALRKLRDNPVIAEGLAKYLRQYELKLQQEIT